jgi:hypothetical protein
MEERSRRIILSGAGLRPPNGSRIAEKTRIAQCASELIEGKAWFSMEVLRRDYSPSNWAVKGSHGSHQLSGHTGRTFTPDGSDIVVLGGEYRAESHIAVGSVAFCGAIAVSGDSAILGVGRITQDGIFAAVKSI